MKMIEERECVIVAFDMVDEAVSGRSMEVEFGIFVGGGLPVQIQEVLEEEGRKASRRCAYIYLSGSSLFGKPCWSRGNM